MEGAPRLTWRTVVGFDPGGEAKVRSLLNAAMAGDGDAQMRLFHLAPVEKVDLALGHYDLPIERSTLAHTHNARPRPRYWVGLCNGAATASLAVPEPFRTVDVITKDGSRVRFHPNDIKALLAAAYDAPRTLTVIGEVCTTVELDAPAKCSMNPAVFLIAAMNRLGVAKQSFIIDALPTIAKQYYAVAEVRAHVLRAPYPLAREPVDPALAGKIASLVDVEIDLVLSSTTLSYKKTNVLDPSGKDGSRYQHVGVVPVRERYTATLALDSSGELIGGRWTGDPPDGPDDILIVEGPPTLTPAGNLVPDDLLPWTLIEELAHASVDEGPDPPTIELRGR
jgi:hypothetical protein